MNKISVHVLPSWTVFFFLTQSDGRLTWLEFTTKFVSRQWLRSGPTARYWEYSILVFSFETWTYTEKDLLNKPVLFLRHWHLEKLKKKKQTKTPPGPYQLWILWHPCSYWMVQKTNQTVRVRSDHLVRNIDVAVSRADILKFLLNVIFM